jgi:hypothetical protein
MPATSLVPATMETVPATMEAMATTMKAVATTMEAMATTMEAMATTMEAVAVVEVGDEEVYIRSHVTVWVRTVGRIIIPVIIYGKGYAACKHKGNRYKKKFFHRAPPSKPFFFSVSCLPYYLTLETIGGLQKLRGKMGQI